MHKTSQNKTQGNSILLKGPQKFEKNLQLVWTVLSKRQNKEDFFFQILWHSHNILTCHFSVRHTLLVHVKFQISIVCGVLKTTNRQKLPQRTIDPLDTLSNPQGVPPI